MKSLSFAGLLLTTSLAAADLAPEIARCAAESSDLARLICYDELARSLEQDHEHLRTDPAFAQPRPPARAATQAQRRAGLAAHFDSDWWELDRQTVNGSETVTLINRAEQDDRPDRLLALDARPDARLVVQCEDTRLRAFIDWDRIMGMGFATLRMEWDGNRAELERTRVASLFWQGEERGERTTRFGDPRQLIDRLRAHDVLTVRTSDDTENSLVARFSLSGLDHQLSALPEGCLSR